jgi:hypothetical protein
MTLVKPSKLIRQGRLIGMAALLTALPVHAMTVVGNQGIEDFDSLDNSWDGSFSQPAVGWVSGGTIQTDGVDLSPNYPPYSPKNVYFGSTITVQLFDPFDYGLPAFGAYVTGSDVVTLDVYAYDYDLATEVLFASVISPGDNIVGGANPPNYYLSFDCGDPFGGCGGNLTRAVFHSDSDFALDNLTLGLVFGAIGIPEPDSWALMIAGMGLVGAGMRTRRARRAAEG